VGERNTSVWASRALTPTVEKSVSRFIESFAPRSKVEEVGVLGAEGRSENATPGIDAVLGGDGRDSTIGLRRGMKRVGESVAEISQRSASACDGARLPGSN